MKFGPIALEHAVGSILAHNIADDDGRRLFNKGRMLSAADLQALRDIGRTSVYAAQLDADDVRENDAATQIAQVVSEPSLQVQSARAGRVNIKAPVQGVLRINETALRALHANDGITLGTLPNNMMVQPKATIATIKILPFAVPQTALDNIDQLVAENGPLISITPLQPKRALVILSGSPTAAQRTRKGFRKPLATRLTRLQASIVETDFIPLEDPSGEEALAERLRNVDANDIDLVILAGETAIMDRHDIVPRAIEAAGGEITCFGAPVDPGNLLLLAELNGLPILGAPGCVRSLKVNVVDWVLPRLLVGDTLTRSDIYALAHGGLLEDTLLRGIPREK